MLNGGVGRASGGVSDSLHVANSGADSADAMACGITNVGRNALKTPPVCTVIDAYRLLLLALVLLATSPAPFRPPDLTIARSGDDGVGD